MQVDGVVGDGLLLSAAPEPEHHPAAELSEPGRHEDLLVAEGQPRHLLHLLHQPVELVHVHLQNIGLQNMILYEKSITGFI